MRVVCRGDDRHRISRVATALSWTVSSSWIRGPRTTTARVHIGPGRCCASACSTNSSRTRSADSTNRRCATRSAALQPPLPRRAPARGGCLRGAASLAAGPHHHRHRQLQARERHARASRETQSCASRQRCSCACGHTEDRRTLGRRGFWCSRADRPAQRPHLRRSHAPRHRADGSRGRRDAPRHGVDGGAAIENQSTRVDRRRSWQQPTRRSTRQARKEPRGLRRRLRDRRSATHRPDVDSTLEARADALPAMRSATRWRAGKCVARLRTASRCGSRRAWASRRGATATGTSFIVRSMTALHLRDPAGSLRARTWVSRVRDVLDARGAHEAGGELVLGDAGVGTCVGRSVAVARASGTSRRRSGRRGARRVGDAAGRRGPLVGARTHALRFRCWHLWMDPLAHAEITRITSTSRTISRARWRAGISPAALICSARPSRSRAGVVADVEVRVETRVAGRRPRATSSSRIGARQGRSALRDRDTVRRLVGASSDINHRRALSSPARQPAPHFTQCTVSLSRDGGPGQYAEQLGVRSSRHFWTPLQRQGARDVGPRRVARRRARAAAPRRIGVRGRAQITNRRRQNASMASQYRARHGRDAPRGRRRGARRTRRAPCCRTLPLVTTSAKQVRHVGRGSVRYAVGRDALHERRPHRRARCARRSPWQRVHRRAGHSGVGIGR